MSPEALVGAKAPDASWDHDAFISYRRRDGSELARWLARRLRGAHLPPSIRGAVEQASRKAYRAGRRIFLDVGFEKPAANFLTEKIFPALDRSASLIVVVTPSAFEQVTGADQMPADNWLCREIDRFIAESTRLGHARPIFVVVGPGEDGSRFPGRLGGSTDWDWVDMRSFRPLGAWTGRDDRAIAMLTAGLYDVPSEFLPALDVQERTRRRQIKVVVGAGLASVAAAAVFGGLSYRLDQDASSRAMAVESARLLPSQPLEATRVALVAVETARTAEALAALRAALLTAPIRTLALGGEGTPLMLFLRARLLVTASWSGRVETLDLDSGIAAVLHDGQGTERIEALGASADGEMLAWAQGNTLTVWRASTGAKARFDLSGKVDRLVFDPGGKRLLVAYDTLNREAKEQSIGPELIDLQIQARVTIAFPGANRAAWNSDGTRLALAAESVGAAHVAVMDPGTRKLVFMKVAADDSFGLRELAFPALTSVAATGASSGRHWRVNTNQVTQLPHTLGPTDEVWWVNSLVVNPNGRQFATFGDDRVPRLWDNQDGRLLASLSPLPRQAGSITFSRDGLFVMAQSIDGTARIWDTSTLAEVSSVASRPGADLITKRAVASQDLSLLAMSARDAQVSVWQMPGMPRWRFDGYPKYGAVAFVDEETIVATDVRTVAMRQLSSSKVLRRYDLPSLAEVGVGRPDKLHVAFERGARALDSQLIVLERNCQLVAWSGARVAPTKISASEPVDEAHCIEEAAILDARHIRASVKGQDRCWKREASAWSTDENCTQTNALARDTASKGSNAYRFQQIPGKGIAVHERASGKTLFMMDSPHYSWRASPNGAFIASSGSGDTVQVWRSSTGLKVADLAGHNEGPVNVVFSPDGRWLLTAGLDGTMFLWEAGTWRRMAAYYGKYGGNLHPVFSPTGARIGVFRSAGIDEQWGTPDGAVLIYECEICAPDNELIEKARRRIAANVPSEP